MGYMPARCMSMMCKPMKFEACVLEVYISWAGPSHRVCAPHERVSHRCASLAGMRNLIDVYVIGVDLMGISLLRTCISTACISQACIL